MTSWVVWSVAVVAAYARPKSGPSVLSHALRETLLSAALRDLRVIRRQLSFPVVAWNTFWRAMNAPCGSRTGGWRNARSSGTASASPN